MNSLWLWQADVEQLSDLSAGGAEVCCRLSRELESRAEGGLWIWDSIMTDTGEGKILAWKWNHHSEFSHLWELDFSIFLFASSPLHDLTDNHHMAQP